MAPGAGGHYMQQMHQTMDFNGAAAQKMFMAHSQMNRREMVVEIELDPELLATFCRRGRRRLRDIETSSQAQLKLDRTRGVLRASGSESSIAEVRRQLESLGGPRKPVTAALWAELMRTRTVLDSPTSAIEVIQQQSSCRVHIERSKHEVRLFGTKCAVAVADRLLNEFQKVCSEDIVKVDDLATLASETLHQIAHTCNVTLRLEGNRIFVLGVEDAVRAAGEELRRYVGNPYFQLQDLFQSSQDAVAAAMSKLKADGKSASDPRTTNTGSFSGSTTQGGEESDQSTDFGVSKEQSYDSKQEGKQSASSGSCNCCKTCGASNFCVNCGYPTGMVQSMSLATFASMPRFQLMPQQMTQMEGDMPMWGCSPMQRDQMPMMPHQFMQGGMMPVCIPAGMFQGFQSFPKGAEGMDGGHLMGGHGSSAYYVPSGDACTL